MAWTYVIDDAALPEGTMAPVYPSGVDVVIARVGGTVYAVSGCCAHMACPLSLGTLNGHAHVLMPRLALRHPDRPLPGRPQNWGLQRTE